LRQYRTILRFVKLFFSHFCLVVQAIPARAALELQVYLNRKAKKPYDGAQNYPYIVYTFKKIPEYGGSALQVASAMEAGMETREKLQGPLVRRSNCIDIICANQ
jgi:hypothetical protein